MVVVRCRVICVASADGPGNLEMRPLIGRVLERYSDIGLATTSDVGDQASLNSIHDVIDGYERPAKAHAIPDRQQAIAWAIGEAQPGDCILIAGCRDAHLHPAKSKTNSDAQTVRELLRQEQADDIEQLILRIHQA